MRCRFITIGALLVASVAGAQDASVRPEIRPFFGFYIPTGDQSNDFKSGTTMGLQGALELSNFAHIVANVGWTRGEAKVFAFLDNATSIWNYDAGAEFNAMIDLNEDWMLRPFLGFGGGVRTYDYKASGVDSRSCALGYGALGSELQMSSYAFRVEGRGYLNCFRSPIDGRKSTRNDMAVTFGLAYHIW